MPLLKLTVAPAAEPITLAELKLQCNIDSDITVHDALISAVIIPGVRALVEKLTRRAFITQSWQQGLDAFPAAEIELLRPPVQSITTVKYTDPAGVLQTLSNTLYTLDADTYPGWLLPAFGTTWPDTRDQANAVLLDYVSGYGATLSAQQADVKAWLLVTGAYMFENREAMVVDGKVAEPPTRFFERLLDDYIVHKA